MRAYFSNMLLSVIIVSFNTKDLTLETIQSVLNSTHNSKILKNNLEIIVIDNNSKDDSVAALKKIKADTATPITLIENQKNVGFGNANNQGIHEAKGDYFLFLNSDTIVKDNALEIMVQRFIDNENLGILSPVLLNIDHTYQPQGGSMPSLFTLGVHMKMLDDLPLIGKYLPSTQHTGKTTRFNLEMLKHYSKPIPVDWVAGTAMMTSRKLIDTAGPFDQNIFMYGEDTELCIRARNHGFLIAIDPSAKVIHIQTASSTSENAIRGEYQAYLYIFSKHKSTTQASLAKMLLQFGALIRIFVFSILAPNKTKVAIYKKVLSDLS